MIVEIIIGFLIGCLIGYMIKKNKMVHGPNSNIVKLQIFEEDGKYYRFVPIAYICPISISNKKRKSNYPVNTYIINL